MNDITGLDPIGFKNFLVSTKCVTLSVCLQAESLQSCPTLCDAIDYNLPGSSVHRILQARILEWVARSSSWDLPGPGIKPASPVSPALAGRFFTAASPGKPKKIPVVIV